MNSYLIRISSVILIPLLFNACMGGAPKPAKTDKSLPKVVINGYLSDMTSIAFEWKPIVDPRVHGVYVYRNRPDSDTPNKLVYVDALNSPKVTHYLDKNLQPEQTYRYRFATFDQNGNTSIASKEIKAETKPHFAPVSFFTTTGPMPRSAKLIWRPHTEKNVVGYIVERRLNGSDTFKKIATVEGRLSAEYIDEGLKDNTRYEYRLKAITYNGILSKPTPSVTVTTKPLPKPLAGVQATQGEPGVIKISWQKSSMPNIDHYRIYRAEESNGDYVLLADQLKGLSYEDKISAPAQAYYYKVIAVSQDNLEGDIKSAKAVRGMTKDAPRAPKNLVAMVENSTVQLTWSSTDKRIVSYVVTKETSKGFMSSETKKFKNIKKSLMIDSSLKMGEAYTYSVVGVDKNGILSGPSNSVHVELQGK